MQPLTIHVSADPTNPCFIDGFAGKSWLPLVSSPSTLGISSTNEDSSPWRTEMLIEYGGPTVSSTDGAVGSCAVSPLTHAEVDVNPTTGHLFDMGTPPLPGQNG